MSTHNQVKLQLSRTGFELDVDLQWPAGTTLVLYGPSGSGKTSVLRCMAGLERTPRARVCIGGRLWQDGSQHFLPAWQRPSGYVFQDASLFQHLNVRDNIMYGLKRVRHRNAARQAVDVEALCELLGIQSLLERPVGTLSGGEGQRVAIARALATGPELLLMDEPLSALDQARRQELLPWLEGLHHQWPVSMLYVTHAPDELLRLADHVALLDAGRVIAQGPAGQVLQGPLSPWAQGTDAGVVVEGRIDRRDAAWHLMCVAFDGGEFWLRDNGAALGSAVRLRVAAQDVSLATAEPQFSSIQNKLRGVIESIGDDTHPSQVLVQVRCGAQLLLARITRRALAQLGLQPGMPIWLLVKSVPLLR
ncbi:MAG: hypothetical protein RLZZ126_1231 [Pseudomonadota bacterium]|jgi:molybdate transport system ATP-binding protein